MNILVHPLALIALLSLSIGSQAQQITTKYNKYMYGGGPHKVWWDALSEKEMEEVDGEDSDREDATPSEIKGLWEYNHNELPLPYFFDKRFAENSRKRYRTQIRNKINSLPPQHATSALGAPSSQEFGLGIDRYRARRIHMMTYIWSGDIYSTREYVMLDGKLREIVGIRVLMLKTIGDYSRNDAKTARRSKWVINDAALILKGLGPHCVLNMCNPAYPCPGHGLSVVAKNRIEKTRTIAEQALLQEAYAKLLESKFARSKELRTQLTKESAWYYRKSLRVRRNGAIAKK